MCIHRESINFVQSYMKSLPIALCLNKHNTTCTCTCNRFFIKALESQTFYVESKTVLKPYSAWIYHYLKRASNP